MLDVNALAGLDWSRVTFPAPAPCAHGLDGAPYCIACLTPILEQAADEQRREFIASALAEQRKPAPHAEVDTVEPPDWELP